MASFGSAALVNRLAKLSGPDRDALLEFVIQPADSIFGTRATRQRVEHEPTGKPHENNRKRADERRR